MDSMVRVPPHCNMLHVSLASIGPPSCLTATSPSPFDPEAPSRFCMIRIRYARRLWTLDTNDPKRGTTLFGARVLLMLIAPLWHKLLCYSTFFSHQLTAFDHGVSGWDSIVVLIRPWAPLMSKILFSRPICIYPCATLSCVYNVAHSPSSTFS